MKWLFPFNTFDSEVKRLAYERADDFLREGKTREEKNLLADQETERFYQSGRLWYILKASWAGTKEQVTSTYRAAFIDYRHRDSSVK